MWGGGRVVVPMVCIRTVVGVPVGGWPQSQEHTEGQGSGGDWGGEGGEGGRGEEGKKIAAQGDGVVLGGIEGVSRRGLLGRSTAWPTAGIRGRGATFTARGRGITQLDVYVHKQG